MSDQDKRCVTCRHYSPIAEGFLGGLGDCNAALPPLPESMPCKEQDLMLMAPDDGTECPCWEAKE